MTTAAFRDVAWATDPTVLRRIASALLLLHHSPEFGNCRRAGPGDPPVALTSPPETLAGHRLSCPTASLPVAGRFPPPPVHGAVRALTMGKGKHTRPSLWDRITRRRQPTPGVRATVAWVDLRTGITHLLTPDVVAAGRVRGRRYIAVCGAQVIPAMKAGEGDCQPCHAAAIPAQRSR